MSRETDRGRIAPVPRIDRSGIVPMARLAGEEEAKDARMANGECEMPIVAGRAIAMSGSVMNGSVGTMARIGIPTAWVATLRMPVEGRSPVAAVNGWVSVVDIPVSAARSVLRVGRASIWRLATTAAGQKVFVHADRWVTAISLRRFVVGDPVFGPASTATVS